MAVFSTNANRHLYVAKAYNATVNDDSTIGTIGGVKTIGEGNEKELFFLYKGVRGSMKSDRIQVRNLDYVKAFKAADLREPLKSVKVALSEGVNDGNLVSGQDYILRINLRHWIGMSEYDQYFKDGAVHATSSMTKEQFYQKMVESLNLCFSREVGATKTSNPYFTFKAEADGITIVEKEQSAALTKKAVERVQFDVQPTTVYFGGEDSVWGTVTDTTPKKGADGAWTPALVVTGINQNAIANGKKIADLEYFCMGERGDQYRGVGYPNIIPTEYLVDATKEYNVLEIHHAFRDEGVNSYRSEKDITIVSDDVAVINGIIGAINSAAGTTIDTLSV